MRFRSGWVGLLLGLAACQSQAPPSQTSSATPPNWDGPIPPKEIRYSKVPSADIFAHYYPDRAQRLMKEGMATLKCHITAEGALKDCRIAEESPLGFGFGAATVKMSAYFQLKPGHYG